ncbi:DNA polymerase III subunit delta [Oceanobacillus halotolerans]|uniref:DNA polymerase III subunit delta n=1 Tax=Oceanobacillus halotolerans TaxID=2663380 RepID=UPI001CF7C2ED|nr:DNA polymerase III subunit delta [Oceanobacillus halotolerans]
MATYMEVMQQVRKKQIVPVYILYGTESYFIQQLKDEITKVVLPANERDNLTTYDLEETPIQEVIADVETYPFFGEKKLIFAYNPTFLKPKPDKLPFEHDVQALEQYVANPVDYSILVLIGPFEKMDERKKVSKSLKKHGLLANCSPIKEYEVGKWIKQLSESLEISIEPDAFEMIEAEFSSDLNLLQSELTKLAFYVGKDGIVTKEVAETMISHSPNSSSLRLVDAVIDKDLYKAISIYKDLEKMKEEPIALIALLAFQFRTILRVKLLKNKGYSQSQMQKQLGVHPYVIKIAVNREKMFTQEKLENIMDRLTKADTQIKRGEMEKQLAFELLLYDII